MRGSVLLARLRSTPARRMAIAVFAVPAILVGLLGMHVLTTGGMSETGISAASHHADDALVPIAAAMAMVPGHETPAPADHCPGGRCGPSHDMLGMMCVLALLVTVVLFSLHMVLTGWRPLKRVVPMVVAKAAALAPPPAPSLHVLSISRT